MLSIILRYGALLAVFLIAVETAQRSYMTDMDRFDIYLAMVAAAFLLLGILLANKLRRPDEPQQTKNQLSVLDRADFSDRELDVLLFMCHGYTNSEIAEQLGITGNTVKTHLKNIYGKLGVTNRTQAAAEAKLLKIVG